MSAASSAQHAESSTAGLLLSLKTPAALPERKKNGFQAAQSV